MTSSFRNDINEIQKGDKLLLSAEKQIRAASTASHNGDFSQPQGEHTRPWVQVRTGHYEPDGEQPVVITAKQNMNCIGHFPAPRFGSRFLLMMAEQFPDNVPDPVIRAIARALLPDMLEELSHPSDTVPDDTKSTDAA